MLEPAMMMLQLALREAGVTVGEHGPTVRYREPSLVYGALKAWYCPIYRQQLIGQRVMGCLEVFEGDSIYCEVALVRLQQFTSLMVFDLADPDSVEQVVEFVLDKLSWEGVTS